jgi:hypothetical protein
MAILCALVRERPELSASCQPRRPPSELRMHRAILDARSEPWYRRFSGPARWGGRGLPGCSGAPSWSGLACGAELAASRASSAVPWAIRCWSVMIRHAVVPA